MEKSEQSEIPLKDILNNIDEAMINFSIKNRKPATRAIVSSRLFALLEGINVLTLKKSGKRKSPKKFVFEKYREVEVYTQEQISNAYNVKVLGISEDKEFNLILGRHSLRGSPKNLSVYNLDRESTKYL